MSEASYPKGGGWRARALVPVLALGLALGPSCRTTPVTGRSSFNLFSTGDEIELGREAYSQVLAEAKVVKTGEQRDMVQRAMTRLVEAARPDDPGFEWEVNLLQDDQTVNAFALPGGKMAVYTGILPVCKTETGLAVVMGHEIAHVMACHGTERMSTGMPFELVKQLTGLGDYAQLAQIGFDLSFNLPFGRKQESEADEIGLVYMATAGYDPREAVAFWERMESTGGGSTPEFLSTHPSHETRIERLKAKLPAALEIWKRVSGGGPSGEESIR